jgi:hypothetical protein
MKIGLTYYTLDKPEDCVVNLLPAIEAALRLTPGHVGPVPLYTPLQLAAELALGNLSTPTTSRFIFIQTQQCTVQVAEDFELDEATDMLLVMNGGTSQYDVGFWKQLARACGYELAIYNVRVSIVDAHLLASLTVTVHTGSCRSPQTGFCVRRHSDFGRKAEGQGGDFP